ncbi:MAG: hypothetical protein HOV87_02595 [Catenulispora sp.]|nr:hypothetical protein [Catenulispora sp.]
MATCLLDYAFSTAPIPLQANAPGATATSRINLFVANPTPGVLCSQIMVAVPVGTAATDFCLEPPAASVNTGKWTIASFDLVKGDELGLPGDGYAKIIFECRDQTDYGLDYSLVLSLVGVVNSEVGEFSYLIQELSGTSPDDLTPKAGQKTIAKQDTVFTLSNFIATAADRPGAPGTAFANGQPLRLSWESTGTWFEVYAKGSPTPLHSGPATSFDLPGGLTADAQFVLAASVSGDPAADSPSPGYQPIYLYDALTLVVTDPDLTPRSVTAQNVTAQGVTAQTLTAQSVTAQQSLTAASAAVNGPLTAGRTTVTGGLNADSAVISNSLTVVSSMNAANALTAGAISTRMINVLGPGESVSVRGGQLSIDTGDRSGSSVVNTSPANASAWFLNRARAVGPRPTGVASYVSVETDCGFYTNGTVVSGAGSAALTHLPTRDGHRVLTSPLTAEAELHLSGSARLSDGRARVEFDEELAQLVFFAEHAAPYRVLLTPTGRCAGLAVVTKSAGHFEVEELAHGRSGASFDWLVIAAVRADGEARAARRLPERLPEAVPPSER